MDEIAEKAELSKPTLYLYFNNKDDLYASIAMEGFQTIKETFRRIDESGAPVTDRMRSMYSAFIEFAMEHRQVSRITEFALSESGRRRVSGELLARMNADIATVLGYAEGVIRQGMDEGIFEKGDDPLVVAIIAWRSVFGLISLAIEGGLEGRGRGFYDGLFESALSILMKGIAAGGGRQTGGG